MRTGHWRQGAEIHCARVEGERFLVNGQHTLTALVQEGLAAWLTVVEIDVPTLAGIGRLYEAFDRNMTRSLDDIYQSDPEIGRYGWTTKQLKAMSGAVALLATGFAQDAPFADIVLTLRDPFVRAELLRDWSGEATQAFGAMQGQLRRYLLRSGVLSVLLATYRYAPPAGRAVLAGGVSGFGAHRGHAGAGSGALPADHPEPGARGPGVCAACRQCLECVLRSSIPYARSCPAPGRIRSALPGRRMTAPRHCTTSTLPGWCSTRRCRRPGRRRRQPRARASGRLLGQGPPASRGGANAPPRADSAPGHPAMPRQHAARCLALHSPRRTGGPTPGECRAGAGRPPGKR